MVDIWAFWKASLAGEKPTASEGDIHQGYFRTRRFDAVAIWFDGEEPFAKIADGPVITDRHAIADLFLQVSSLPISYKAYQDALAGKPWPHEVEASAGIGHNSGSTLDELQADIDEWDRIAKQEMSAGPITDQERSDRMANISTKLGELEKTAEELRKAEKEPYLKGGQAVDDKWKPIVLRASRAKAAAKAAVAEFLKAEERKRAAAARAAAEAAGVDPSAVSLEKARAGQKRAVVLKTRTVITVVDVAATAAFFASMDEPPAELRDVLRTLANRAVSAGVKVPGISIESQQYAA